MNNIFYKFLLPACVVAVIFVGINAFTPQLQTFFTENEDPSTTTIVKTTDSDYIRLGEYSQNYKIISDVTDNSRNFVFLDEEGKIASTLRVSNPRYGPPSYNIVKGKKHDWLVVTVLAGSGTGYKSEEDVWYSLDYNNEMVSGLSYASYVMHSPAQEDNSKTSFLSAMVTNDLTVDDTKIDVNYIYKICDIDNDGNEQNCTEKSNIVNYVWDEKVKEFKLKE